MGEVVTCKVQTCISIFNRFTNICTGLIGHQSCLLTLSYIQQICCSHDFENCDLDINSDNERVHIEYIEAKGGFDHNVLNSCRLQLHCVKRRDCTFSYL